MNELLAIFNQELPPNIYWLTEMVTPEDIFSLSQQYSFKNYYLEGEKIHEKSEFLNYCSLKMEFPDYFGNNWDAFEDCLTDQLLSENVPILLFYSTPEVFSQNDPQEWDKLLDILGSVIDFLQERNIKLYVILQLN